MMLTQYAGQDVYLIDDKPNWLKGYQTEFVSELDSQASLTKRDSRRPWSFTLRTTVKCASTVADAALRTLLGQLRRLKAHPVLSPFWPGVAFWSDRAAMRITGGLMLAFKRDFSQWEIYEPGAEPAWPAAGDFVAPLLWGFLRENKLKWVNASTATWPQEFVEASKSEWALQFSSDALADGPLPAGYATAPKLLPFRPDHRAVEASVSVDVRRDESKFQRERRGTFYPHDPWEGQSAQFTIRGLADIGTFIAWFANHAGQGESFWAPSSFERGRLSVAAGSADVALTLTGVEAIQQNDLLCAFVGGVVYFAKVNTIVGSVINLFAAFGVALPAGAQLFSISLAKIDGAKMTVTWKSVDLAVIKLSWSELRPELVLPGNETLGVTIGALKRKAVLFHFFRDFGNGTVVDWYFTSFERDIEWNGQTWIHDAFEPGELTQAVNLEDTSAEVKGFLTNPDGTLWAGNPLLLDASGDSEVPLNIKVYFVEVEQFAGEILGAGGNQLFGAGGETIQEPSQ